MGGKRVAIVGAGISGLSAAWLLNRSGAHVTLFEEGSLGGHTLTDTTSAYPVDLGFQVYNLTTYPNFVGLLEELNVETEQSDMSFALSLDDGRLEWGSDNPNTIFAQRSNLLKPSFWRMIADVIRFGRQAPEVLKPENQRKFGSMLLGEYLRLRGYSEAFQRNYVLPMCAAVWSVPTSQVMLFPVVMLVRFWVNHHLLDLVQRPVWRVVKDRSRKYVEKIVAELPDVREGQGVASVVSQGPEGPVEVTTQAGQVEIFDAVILATHSDISLRLLKDSAPEGVREVLSAIPYSESDVYLHTDAALMPRRAATWSCWNFLGTSSPTSPAAAAESHAAAAAGPPTAAPVCVTYWLNRLQNLPAAAPPLFCTLNPPAAPAAGSVVRHLRLAHPVFSAASEAAQAALPQIQGRGGIHYAGAWCGYGFHEDGLKAGMAAAAALGAGIPWTPRACSPKIGLLDRCFMAAFHRFTAATVAVGRLKLILPNGEELIYGSADSVAVKQPADEAWMGRPKLQATLRIFDCAFFRKVVTRHDTGMGESYMDGDFEVDSIGGLMALAVANVGSIESKRGMLGLLDWAGQKVLAAAHAARANTRQGSRKNIEEHYDAGNAMYRLFLDPTMTYSCAIHLPGDDLETAQLRKLDALIAKAGLKASDHVLEIGCGWGSLAIRAVQTTGCRWTGLTISSRQLEEATERVAAAGLQDRISLLFCDYRDCPGAGTYDKVVSCEMIEAVGHEHLQTYFQCIGQALKPGGSAVIQVISQPEERYEAYCAGSDFIRAHIFPGGHLPSLGALADASRGTGLLLQRAADIGPHYAVTLREWRARWEERREEVLALGYPDSFWRKYRFYFAYCEAAFDGRHIQVHHLTWDKLAGPPAPPAPLVERAGSGMLERTPHDPVTQVLLAVYFFLAGIVVGQSRMLWLLPAASSCFAALLAATAYTSNALLPDYRKLSEQRQAAWCSAAVHLAYSAAAAAAAAAFLWRHPAALAMAWRPAAPAELLLPHAAVCISAGFLGFRLWTLVHNRLYRQRYLLLLHHVLLLCCFSAAAIKAEHTPALCASLLAEASSVFALLGKLQVMTGSRQKTSLRRFARAAELALFPLTRLLPHLLMLCTAIFRASAFSSQVSHWIAVSGLLYINASNVRKAVSLYASHKSHTA